jgi:hypothetical protein
MAAWCIDTHKKNGSPKAAINEGTSFFTPDCGEVKGCLARSSALLHVGARFLHVFTGFLHSLPSTLNNGTLFFTASPASSIASPLPRRRRTAYCISLIF